MDSDAITLCQMLIYLNEISYCTLRYIRDSYCCPTVLLRKALRALRCGELKPYVIHVRPVTSLERLMTSRSSSSRQFTVSTLTVSAAVHAPVVSRFRLTALYSWRLVSFTHAIMVGTRKMVKCICLLLPFLFSWHTASECRLWTRYVSKGRHWAAVRIRKTYNNIYKVNRHKIRIAIVAVT